MILDRLKTAVYQSDGPMTRELLRTPGNFGLGQLPQSLEADATVTSVCGYCSTGCGLNVHLKNGRAAGLTPKAGYPVNLGMACPKGWEALEVLKSDERATQPLLRKNGTLTPVSWNEALDVFCERTKAVQAQHGADAAAFLSTGQIATEEMALLGALAKFGMGMVHGDGNTRQCMATAVVAYKQAFGFDAPPFTYADFEQSDTLVFWGANPCIAHPIMWERVMRNVHRRDGGVGPKIACIDPRRTETAMQSTLHLPLRPKSDLTLAYGLAKWIIDGGYLNEQFVDDHTSGFETYAEHVAAFDLDRVIAETGLRGDDIEALAYQIATGRAVSQWWTMGVNQSHEGVRLAQAIIALSLMTGQIGRPGTGANSITGQANAMGSRLFSNTTSLLGGRSFESAEDRTHVARTLDIDVAAIPDRPSMAYHEILEAVTRGEVRSLWVIATNPAHSWIQRGDLAAVREKLDFLVVQDMYATAETAQIADLVLPAAGWGEKDGTFINSERRIGRHRQVAAAPGEALSDFRIFRAIAEQWGCGRMFDRWSSPAAVFEILKELSAETPCDFTGIEDLAELDLRGGVQWPWTKEDAERTRTADESLRDTATDLDCAEERRLFADGRFFHDDGRARFIADDPRPVAEPTDAEYPLTLLTGRGSASQWHTQTRTAKSAVLRKLYPADAYAEIHPTDAAAADVASGDTVTVASRRASVDVRAFVTPTVGRGQIFLPMHTEQTNRLTKADFDPHSKQPSYKHSAVRIAAAGD